MRPGLLQETKTEVSHENPHRSGAQAMCNMRQGVYTFIRSQLPRQNPPAGQTVHVLRLQEGQPLHQGGPVRPPGDPRHRGLPLHHLPLTVLVLEAP